MAPKSSTSEFFTSTHDGYNPRLLDLADEAVNKIVGPMPVQEFLEEFLPYSSAVSQPLESYQDEVKKVLNSEDEPEMYGPLVKAIQTLCHNFSVVDTHDNPFPLFHKVTIKPDLCIYPKDDTTDITTVEIMIEAKYRNDLDPFIDSPSKPLVINTELANETLGQIASYAAAQQSAQFRSSVFSLLVFPKYARILRWDRSGVIVTSQIPWLSAGVPEFFRRFDCMTAEQRGVDPTVTRPSSSNERRARNTFHIGDDVSLIQVSVGGSDYVVPRNTYMSGMRSPFGRSTQPFFAYSVSTKKNIFLKDNWRLQSQTAEHHIYAELKKHQVPYIATVLAGEDVLDRQTRTQDFAERKPKWAKDCPKGLKTHVHYRLVLEEIGTPLKNFSSTKQLVKVTREALIAHKMAFEKADILHRDISSNNILIYEGSALLIDWDLSKNRKDIEQEKVPERTGTWQFRADRLLNPPIKDGPHTVTDDVESFVHVITWIAFKYAGHNMCKEDLTIFFRCIYDHCRPGDEGQTNFGAKSRFLRTPMELEETEFNSKNLKSLLLCITDVVSTRYHRRSPLARLNERKRIETIFGRDSRISPECGRWRAEREEEMYQNNLTALKSSDWIIETFSNALNLGNWPENDAAEEHKLAKLVESAEGYTVRVIPYGW